MKNRTNFVASGRTRQSCMKRGVALLFQNK